MKVVILAAGYGTRLQATFPDTPKALVPVRGKPFIEHQLELLKRGGFREFIVCVGYRARDIKEYCGDGSKWGISIDYSEEEEPQGTGTTLRYALPVLDEATLAVNGDTYLPADYGAFVEAHRKEAAKQRTIASIGLIPLPPHQGSGRVMLDARGRITDFMEKASDKGEGLVNAGVYMVEQALYEEIPEGPSSLEQNVFPKLAAKGLLFGVRLQGSFIDIGTPAGHAALEASL